MIQKYSLVQFPKNKRFDLSALSIDQKSIRINLKKNSTHKKCKTCLIEQDIFEFYIKDKNTGRRANKCRDCQMKESGVLNIGKQRVHEILFEKGLMNCSDCKELKPLTNFNKNASAPCGYVSICYPCQKKRVDKFVKESHKNIGEFYIKQFRKRNEKICVGLSDENVKQLIQEKRKPKYFLDGQEFLTSIEFSDYIFAKYNIKKSTTIGRLYQGKSEKECTISEFDCRSMAQKLVKTTKPHK